MDVVTPLYTPARNLRSEGEAIRLFRNPDKRFGEIAFSFAAAVEWYNLPNTLLEDNTLSQFKSGIKTYLFTTAFSIN